MIDPAGIPVADVHWRGAVRIIRSIFPPIDLFEDIADPADWALLISAEQKTNPRIMETIGNLDLLPVDRRVSGPGASYLMAPFTHVSPLRPSRFSDGSYGALYVGKTFEVALLETVHHHAVFMANTAEEPGWTSQFRELTLDVDAALHDIRGDQAGLLDYAPALLPDDYAPGQHLASRLRADGSQGIVYPSVRCEKGQCVAAFYPDICANLSQGRHLDYHWNGERIDYYRDRSGGAVFAIT